MYFEILFVKIEKCALENEAYTTNIQPVNSDLSPFYSFFRFFRVKLYGLFAI